MSTQTMTFRTPKPRRIVRFDPSLSLDGGHEDEPAHLSRVVCVCGLILGEYGYRPSHNRIICYIFGGSSTVDSNRDMVKNDAWGELAHHCKRTPWDARPTHLLNEH